ncbi:hypothetical protein SY83_17495 [Paenibacillus swuensis]|uniref:Uncharacterized protein n=1 Tax=Paenibacillus swuensis TaxID=1178515 RepID=A0A172TL37_9BACL|nr:hypothetical protein [Paenibacillus swuensis]ANE47779.1 hypothetical protein SY83_17495 [Paenibacillus swuensis]
MVPYGYVPDPGSRRGTFIVYDTFDHQAEKFTLRLLSFALDRRFRKWVGYVLSEATLKRMKLSADKPYYKRIDELGEILEDYRNRDESGLQVSIDNFEDKRGKYTPFEMTMRFLQDKYDGPIFIAMRKDTANRLAQFGALDPWIREVRFVLIGTTQDEAHPMLQAKANRWEWYM